MSQTVLIYNKILKPTIIPFVRGYKKHAVSEVLCKEVRLEFARSHNRILFDKMGQLNQNYEDKIDGKCNRIVLQGSLWGLHSVTIKHTVLN